ncbi:MAG: nitronate monooxygenase, partial [Acidimicrobiales bacterium]
MAAPNLSDVLRRPVVVAPMAGGPSTPDLVVAAAGAGTFGFLAGGYKTAAALVAEMTAVRAATSEAFGVNLFVPGAPTGDTEGLARYLGSLGDDARAVGVALGGSTWDDDHYDEKLAAVMADPPAVVSFTFGCPPAEVLDTLTLAGAVVAVTVTSASEAAVAADAGAHALLVQGSEAGAHRGTFTDSPGPRPDGDGVLDLLRTVGQVTDVPLLAAGGIMTARHLAVARRAGAAAMVCGTAFLRCPESGAHPLYKEALVDPRFPGTVVTRAFSGRRARGLVNDFVRRHADAPSAYPEINNATRPLRAA